MLSRPSSERATSQPAIMWSFRCGRHLWREKPSGLLHGRCTCSPSAASAPSLSPHRPSNGEILRKRHVPVELRFKSPRRVSSASCDSAKTNNNSQDKTGGAALHHFKGNVQDISRICFGFFFPSLFNLSHLIEQLREGLQRVS